MATSEKSRLGRDVIRGVPRLQKITEAATKWEKLQPAFDGISLSFCIEIAEAQECFEARSLLLVNAFIASMCPLEVLQSSVGGSQQ